MYRKIILCALLLCTTAFAHEMTPTYPKLEPSHVSGVYKAKMGILNRRKDVQFYEIGVFTEDWQPIPFVSAYRHLHLSYLQHLQFDVYIRISDIKRATYVCSKSEIRAENATGTAVASKICSRFKS